MRMMLRRVSGSGRERWSCAQSVGVSVQDWCAAEEVREWQNGKIVKRRGVVKSVDITRLVLCQYMDDT